MSTSCCKQKMSLWLRAVIFVGVARATFSESRSFTDGVVNLNGFNIQGELVNNVDNNQPGAAQQFTYYGIKYGKSQRWQSATINSNYDYKRDSSIPSKGHRCTSSQFEDCLYLDVYVPPVRKDHENLIREKFPVFFWVHGGSLTSGSKDEYPAADLAKGLSAIVVTIQYRLGPLGFLSTGDSVVPGNLGLQDAKLALRWVEENIDKFYGDPAAITLTGHSAGSRVSTAMLLDPEVRLSVRSAISMSGSILSPFSLRNDGFKTVAKLADLLNCPKNSSAAAITCLKTKSIQQISAAAGNSVFHSSSVLAGLPWTFIADGIHIPPDPVQYLLTQNQKLRGGFLTGYLTEDAATFIDYPISYWPNMLGQNRPTTTWIKDFAIKEFLKNNFHCQPTDPTVEMVEEVFEFFAFEQHSDLERRKDIIKLATMSFAIPSMLEAQIYSERGLAELGSQLFVVSYAHDFKPQSLQNQPTEVLNLIGAYHFTDVQYLFGPTLTNSATPPSKTSFEVLTQQMRMLWSQIIHNGTASGPPFDAEQGDHFVLGADKRWKLSKSSHFHTELEFMERLKLWKCGRNKPPSKTELVKLPGWVHAAVRKWRQV